VRRRRTHQTMEGRKITVIDRAQKKKKKKRERTRKARKVKKETRGNFPVRKQIERLHQSHKKFLKRRKQTKSRGIVSLTRPGAPSKCRGGRGSRLFSRD